jgi:adenylosuccinate lyase
MAAGLAGDQWNEGDVSCSVVRRVMLPDACFAMDGLFETLLTVLNQMEVYEQVVEQENRHYLPFLLTTTVLMAAVKAGAGRESAHQIIKQHAVATLDELRTGKIASNDLFTRLAQDSRLKVSSDQLSEIFRNAKNQVGAADQQIGQFVAKVKAIVAQFPAAAQYQPGRIL